MDQPTRGGRERRPHPLATAVIVGVAIALAETLLNRERQGFLSPHALRQHLAWAAAAYGLAVPLLTAVSLLSGGLPRDGRRAVAVAAGLWVGAAALGAVRAPTPQLALLAPACLALGWGVYRVAAVVLGRLPFAGSAALWSAGALGLLGLLAVGSPDPWLAPAAVWALRALVAVSVLGGWLLCRPSPGLLRFAVATLLPALLLVAGQEPPAWAQRASEAGPGARNLLLITIDTLRSDHLGCYGDREAETPRIDALAAEGVLFEQAISQIPLTGPSHTTMLTGLYPVSHGATTNGRRPRRVGAGLPAALAGAGYRTAAFVSGFTLTHQASGLGRWFDRYDDDLSPWSWLPEPASHARLPRLATMLGPRLGHEWRPVERRAEATTGRATAWLRGHGERPFLLWVHYFDPHRPYDPPAPFDRRFDPSYDGEADGGWFDGAEHARVRATPRDAEHLRALYSGEIAYTDTQVGRLLDALVEAELDDSTVVILTADHGESLGEHDYWFDHSERLYEPSLKVPLIVRLPDRAGGGRRVRTPVRLVDLAPTAAELAGVELPVEPEGVSLVGALAGGPVRERPALSAVRGSQAFPEKSVWSVRYRGHKLIRTSAWWMDHIRFPPARELYDLRSDPAEESNLLALARAREPESEPRPAADGAEAPVDPALAELESLLAAWVARGDGEGREGPGADDDLRRQLEALGYLQTDG